MKIKWGKLQYKAWDKSCEVCALKRGYTKADLAAQPYPFMCVHREDGNGMQRVCAGDKKKLELFKGS